MRGIYLIVEGIGESYLYPEWIKLLPNAYNFVDDHTLLTDDLIYLISGGGQPAFYSIITNAIADIEGLQYKPLLVICLDSEEQAPQDLKSEIDQHIASINSHIEYTSIIQHCCIETWGLSNKAILKSQPKSEELRSFKSFYDVSVNDPENMQSMSLELTKAQFAFKYLKLALQDKFRRLSINKAKPEVLAHPKYLERVKNRYAEGHIQEFGNFLRTFSQEQ